MAGMEETNENSGRDDAVQGGTLKALSDPETPKLGYELAAILMIPAVLVALALYFALTVWLELSFGGSFDLAMGMPLILILGAITETRPANRGHWTILIVTVVLAAASSAIATVCVRWLFVRLAPDYGGELVMIAVASVASCLAIVLVLLIAFLFTRAENLFFPSYAAANGGDAG